MGIAAIICEYNPFHEGHRYQISRTREETGDDILCLMSGNYVQRGEPAIADKWTRTAAALDGGADLVLELPLTIAVHAAGYFAAGAAECLDRLGAVDVVSFGSETGELASLIRAAVAMNEAGFDAALRDALKTGISYAAARQQVLGTLGDCLATPNSALGVDYIRGLQQRNSPIRPLAIPRDPGGPSATALREAMTGHTLRNGERAMLAVLRTLPAEAFEKTPFGGEGLWRLVERQRYRADSLEDLLQACKSKRYTMSRLKRMLLWLFLGLDSSLPAAPYLKVLGFNDRGRSMLRQLKQTTDIPLVTRRIPDSEEARAYHRMVCRATDLYGLFAPPGEPAPTGWEQTRAPAGIRR